MRTLAARLWAARGLFGGLAAAGLALLGQLSQVRDQDQNTAGRYYIAAIVILIASLIYPGKSPARRTAAAPPVDTLPQRPAIPPATPLPTRAARSASAAQPLPTRRSGVDTASPPGAARRTAARAALGWRVPAAGSLLTLIFATASALLLWQNTGSVLGGWLWAAGLLAMLLTAWSVREWPRGNGLLPSPRADFFGRGLPMISPRLEAALVAAVLIVGLALRLYNLEYHPGIFGDEGERGSDARGILQGNTTSIFGYGWYNVPKFYFYCVAWMLRIFGDSMVGDRMLSVISGMIVLWFVYRTGKLLFGTRVGLVAAALMAASPLALQFSRQASESSPTGALWAAGFYFLFLALRHRRWRDWALCGLLWGFSLYFYASGKLIVPIAAAVGLYCLVRWRGLFFKRYALGFALAALAMGLTFMPNALLNIQDHWNRFAWRSQETAIYAPAVQRQAFGRFNIPFDPGWASQPLLQNVAAHPAAWAQLMLNQVRVSVEVLYRSGDPTAYYQVRDHNGSMLPPVLAAIALLGLVYAAWKVADARFGILDIWFWGGMLGVALTMDAPSVQRLAGAWPAIMLFPAALLERIFASAWPLNLGLARRWAAVPLAGLVLFLGVVGYQEYFVHYAALCPYCRATLQARYVQALGSDYKAYELSKGDEVYISYGSTRFVANGVEGIDLQAPLAKLPVTDNHDKGAAFMVWPSNMAYLPTLKAMYPDGQEEAIRGSDGNVYFTSYKVSAGQMARYQSSNATYTGSNGHKASRIEEELGMTDAWHPPTGVSYPLKAEWKAGLVAPSYAIYTFQIQGSPDATLEIDGKPLPLAPVTIVNGPNGKQGEIIMAAGLHDVLLGGTVQGPGSKLALRWASRDMALQQVPPGNLYDGQAGGLLAEIGPGSSPEALKSANPFVSIPVRSRRVYPGIGFRESVPDFGTQPFTVRFEGTLHIDRAGPYGFDTNTSGPCVLFIDGQLVLDNTQNGMAQTTGRADLAAGAHVFELRTMWGDGPSPIELFWTPPGGEHALVPPTAFTTLTRSWLRGEVPDPQ